MSRKKKLATQEESAPAALPRYKIKPCKGKFDLLQDGGWLGTYDTEAEAQADLEERQNFDRIRGSAPV